MNNIPLKWFYVILVASVGVACKKKQNNLFELVSPESSNIKFENSLKPTVDVNILDYLYYYNGGGVAIGDINNDNLPDIFFTGNQVQNKLYLNKGNLQFEDITEKSGVGGNSDWNTGVTMADVNGDGLLDIYVCAVSGINKLQGRNELFINNGDLNFSEEANKYQLDFENYSTQAAFFDYDNDGDLDMYLLNQAIHHTESYGPSTLRNTRKRETGDKLLRNDQNVFVDVSSASGIYGSGIGYGLGVCTADFNNDGFTDLYISNDFHENDYYYLNQRDGTFKESVKSKFGHVSRFSMGSDASDVNNDGYYDLITLDMLPESEAVLKASVGEDNVDIHNLKVNKLGYHNQYARNMLQMNQGASFFTETALYSGVSATDWSWSALFADFDLDGNQDLFISNGVPKRPNDLDYINYISNEKIKNQLENSNTLDQQVLDYMPSGASQNYMYQGTGTMQFVDQSASWLPQDISFSNGSAYADLDNDGDLDLMTNNTNAAPLVYENTRDDANHYLKLKLADTSKNRFGIGSKAIVYQKGKKQYKQLFTSKGFQSSSEPIFHFGYESEARIDSVAIIWTDQTTQIVKNIQTDTTITIKKGSGVAATNYSELFPKFSQPIFSKAANFGIDFIHKENDFIDFKREGLIPYKISDRTRAMVIGDINNDEKDDVFFGGSKTKKATIYIQNEQEFVQQNDSIVALDAMSEDVYVLLDDFDGKNGNDLIIASGGGEFFRKSIPLLDRYYQNTGNGNFKKDISFPKFFENGSVVKTADIDNDGDLDLFVGARAVANDFGSIPNSYLLENTNDGFKVIENSALQKIGMVTDAIFSDYDADGDEDLIVVGEWMAPTFYQNNKGVFEKEAKIEEPLNGLWQTVAPFDIDGDGDIDYVLGNWGLNSKYKANKERPMLLYHGDIDNNGKSESIVTISKKGNYYTINNFAELAEQLPMLKKKFHTNHEFAGKSIKEIFDLKVFKNLSVLKVHELASGYLRNDEGSFVFVPFKEQLQLAPITAALVDDFSGNGRSDMLLAGNYMGVTPYHGRLDGFAGALLFDDGTIQLGHEIGINLIQKQVSQMSILTFENKKYVVVMINNEPAEIYELTRRNLKQKI